MNEYQQRLLRVQKTLAADIDAHHETHGTIVPSAERVTVLNITENHATVGFPVNGADGIAQLGMNVADDRIEGRNVARIVACAQMWLRWYARVPEITAELPAEIARLTRDTDVEIVGIMMTGVTGTEHAVTVHHYVDVRQLNGALRHHAARWSIHRDEVATGASEWHLRENVTLLPMQRRLSRLLREAGGRPRMTVERSLAKRLLAMPNRRDASKKLFAAQHGETGTKVPWQAITLMEAREGRIVGTIPLSDTARIRDDTITVKGAALPESVLGALTGRPIERFVEHPLLHGRTIRTARNAGRQVIVTLERDDVDCEELKRTLDGEA